MGTSVAVAPTGRATAQTHPFLIVTADQYTEIRARASSSPWSAMKAEAIAHAQGWSFDGAGDFADKCWDLVDIDSTAALAYILDPGNKTTYKNKILSAISEWDGLVGDISRSPWTSIVPPTRAFFNAVLALDIVHGDLSAGELSDAEAHLQPVGDWICANADGSLGAAFSSLLCSGHLLSYPNISLEKLLWLSGVLPGFILRGAFQVLITKSSFDRRLEVS